MVSLSLPTYRPIYLSAQLPGQPFIYSSRGLYITLRATNLSHVCAQLSFLRQLAGLRVTCNTEVVTQLGW